MRKFLSVMIIFLFTAVTSVVTADPPPPPGNPGTGGGGGGPVGAPIDGGLGILLAMGAVYGGKKMYKYRKETQEAREQECCPGKMNDPEDLSQ
jgi:hypothetical protein